MNDPVHRVPGLRAAKVLTGLGTPGWVPVFSAVTNQQVHYRTRLYLIRSLRFAEDEERVAAVFQQLQLDPNGLVQRTASIEWRFIEEIRVAVRTLRERKLQPEVDAKVGESK